MTVVAEQGSSLRARLLGPLVIMLVMIVTAFSLLTLYTTHEHLHHDFVADLVSLRHEMSDEIQHHTELLATLMQPLQHDSRLHRLLSSSDLQALQMWAIEHAQTITAGLLATELVIHAPDGKTLAHICPHRGNIEEEHDSVLLDRAVKTGAEASGLELGHCGMLAMRLISPVLADGVLLGYISLGQSIEKAVAHVAHKPSMMSFLLVDKARISRQLYELMMQMQNKEPLWDALPHSVFSYYSHHPVSDDLLLRFNSAFQHDADHEELFLHEGEFMRIAFLPVYDTADSLIGEVVVVRDVTELIISSLASVSVAVCMAFAGGGLLLLYAYRLLGRVETRLSGEQAALRESEARYHTLFEQSLDPILIIDTEGNYLHANSAALVFHECDLGTLLSKNLRDFIPRGDKRADKLTQHHDQWQHGGMIETACEINHSIKYIQLSITPVSLDGQNAIVAIGRDVTRKRADEKKLKEQLEELREFQRLTVGRELRMEEIENENRALKERLGRMKLP